MHQAQLGKLSPSALQPHWQQLTRVPCSSPRIWSSYDTAESITGEADTLTPHSTFDQDVFLSFSADPGFLSEAYPAFYSPRLFHTFHLPHILHRPYSFHLLPHLPQTLHLLHILYLPLTSICIIFNIFNIITLLSRMPAWVGASELQGRTRGSKRNLPRLLKPSTPPSPSADFPSSLPSTPSSQSPLPSHSLPPTLSVSHILRLLHSPPPSLLGLRGLSGAMVRVKSSTIGYAGDDSDSLSVQHSCM